MFSTNSIYLLRFLEIQRSSVCDILYYKNSLLGINNNAIIIIATTILKISYVKSTLSCLRGFISNIFNVNLIYFKSLLIRLTKGIY